MANSALPGMYQDGDGVLRCCKCGTSLVDGLHPGPCLDAIDLKKFIAATNRDARRARRNADLE